jgi:hypothetical protein
LLRHNLLALEIAIGPPLRAIAIALNRLGEEPIPVPGDGLDVDGAGLKGPEAPAARFVL